MAENWYKSPVDSGLPAQRPSRSLSPGWQLAYALSLQALGIPLSFAGYAAVLLCPFWAFTVGLTVTLRQGLPLPFRLVMALPWFFLPAMHVARSGYTADQIKAYGLPPFDYFSRQVLFCAALGIVLAGNWLWWGEAKTEEL